MNISKMYLHVEQLSLKTNWNWQKDSCTTKAVRKIQRNWIGREEKQSGLDLWAWKGAEKKRGSPRVE